jgi:hypothetical protein
VLSTYCCEIQKAITALWNLKQRLFKQSFLGRERAVKLTGGSPSSFCHIAELGGFESTSHLRDTGIPSRNGYPKPGVRVMAKDGVSKGETKKEKQVVIQNDTHETDSQE